MTINCLDITTGIQLISLHLRCTVTCSVNVLQEMMNQRWLWSSEADTRDIIIWIVMTSMMLLEGDIFLSIKIKYFLKFGCSILSVFMINILLYTAYQTINYHFRSHVCPMNIRSIEGEAARVKRAGASAIYFNGSVLLCGGRLTRNRLSDCMSYNIADDLWSEHSILLRPREEAAIAKISSRVLLIGGLFETSVEIWDPTDNSWKLGAELPNVVSRGCAVSTGDSIILTGGHDNSSFASLATVLKLSADTGNWQQIESMIDPRRDHTCLYVEFERSKGLLVAGGLGASDEVLDSVEFYDLEKSEWTRVSSLKVPRAEHTMSLVYGLPTVMGKT